jgi:hypothetical protein
MRPWAVVGGRGWRWRVAAAVSLRAGLLEPAAGAAAALHPPTARPSSCSRKRARRRARRADNLPIPPPQAPAPPHHPQPSTPPRTPPHLALQLLVDRQPHAPQPRHRLLDVLQLSVLLPAGFEAQGVPGGPAGRRRRARGQTWQQGLAGGPEPSRELLLTAENPATKPGQAPRDKAPPAHRMISCCFDCSSPMNISLALCTWGEGRGVARRARRVSGLSEGPAPRALLALPLPPALAQNPRRRAPAPRAERAACCAPAPSAPCARAPPHLGLERADGRRGRRLQRVQQPLQLPPRGLDPLAP